MPVITAMKKSMGGICVEGVSTAAAMLNSRNAYLKFRMRNFALTSPMRLRIKSSRRNSPSAAAAAAVDYPIK